MTSGRQMPEKIHDPRSGDLAEKGGGLSAHAFESGDGLEQLKENGGPHEC